MERRRVLGRILSEPDGVSSSMSSIRTSTGTNLTAARRLWPFAQMNHVLPSVPNLFLVPTAATNCIGSHRIYSGDLLDLCDGFLQALAGEMPSVLGRNDPPALV